LRPAGHQRRLHCEPGRAVRHQLLRVQAADHGCGGGRHEDGPHLSQNDEGRGEAAAGGVLADQVERHPGVAVQQRRVERLELSISAYIYTFMVCCVWSLHA